MKTPSKQELQTLRDDGTTRDEIAEIYGVSTAKVKRWLHSLGVIKRKPKVPPAPPVSLDWDEGMTMMEKCQLRLGTRMVETPEFYLLDGEITSSHNLIAAAKIY